MNIENKLNQLPDLMTELVPTVDKLANEVNVLSQSNQKANIERAELRLSNLRLANAIESLVSRSTKT
jgi:outer membrane murein-binding lipoprotein Lpp